MQQQQREREIDLFQHAAAHRSNATGTPGGPYLGSRYTLSSNRGLGSIYNVASSLLHDTYLYGGGPSGLGGHSRDLNRLRRGLRRFNETEIILGAHPHGAHHGQAGQLAIDKLSRGGRQLLDHESLTCLLVLLFIDDTRLNIAKLHRVIRNLCIHGPSRAWIIKALLSILEKVSGGRQDESASKVIMTGGQLAIEGGTDTGAKNHKQTKVSKIPGKSGVLSDCCFVLSESLKLFYFLSFISISKPVNADLISWHYFIGRYFFFFSSCFFAALMAYDVNRWSVWLEDQCFYNKPSFSKKINPRKDDNREHSRLLDHDQPSSLSGHIQTNPRDFINTCSSCKSQLLSPLSIRQAKSTTTTNYFQHKPSGEKFTKLAVLGLGRQTRPGQE